jgi:hypothetical protein
MMGREEENILGRENTTSPLCVLGSIDQYSTVKE